MEIKGDKQMLLKDSDDIEFILEFKVEDDHIHFKIVENKVYAPFTFEANFTMQDFINRSPAFKSCDKLEEVLYHLKNLYNQNKITLDNLGPKKERYLTFTLMDISEEKNTQYFVVNLEMTQNKDKALDDLYNIQRDQIELFKNIKLLIEKNLANEHPLKKSINDILDECGSKILVN